MNEYQREAEICTKCKLARCNEYNHDCGWAKHGELRRASPVLRQDYVGVRDDSGYGAIAISVESR